jgi:hypothetical protein
MYGVPGGYDQGYATFTGYQGMPASTLGFMMPMGGQFTTFNFAQQPTYIIRSKINGRVLDVSQTNDWGNQQGDLIIYDYVGGLNQQWHLIREGPDFVIRSAQTGKVLDSTFSGEKHLNLNPTSLGSNVTQFFNQPRVRENEYNGSYAQKWRIHEVTPGAGEFFIYCSGTGKVLDVKGESGYNNTPVIPYDFHGKNNQIWQIAPINAMGMGVGGMGMGMGMGMGGMGAPGYGAMGPGVMPGGGFY